MSVVHLAGLPSDLTGWAAVCGLASLLVDAGRDDVQIGWRYTDRLPWSAVVQGVELSELLALVEGARPSPITSEHPLSGAGVSKEPLFLGGGRSTPAGTLQGIVRALASRDVAEDLTQAHLPVQGCPTWRLSPDSATPRALVATQRPACGRPVAELLAAVWLSRFRPWRVVEDGRVWRLWWLHTPLPPSALLLAQSTRYTRPGLVRWGAQIVASDKYRRQAQPPAPIEALGCWAQVRRGEAEGRA